MLLKVLLIAVFLMIFLQDKKDRMVYWSLYLLAGIFCFWIQLSENILEVALMNVVFNLFLIGIVIAVSYLYTTRVKKIGFLNESIGGGDILLFIALCFSFSTVAFILLFTFSLLFALVLHLYASKKDKQKTVPLAGYMALFFSGVYLISFFTPPKHLFA